MQVSVVIYILYERFEQEPIEKAYVFQSILYMFSCGMKSDILKDCIFHSITHVR